MNNVNSGNRLRHVLVSALLLVGAAAALPAGAAIPDVPFVKVSYGDLDLSHSAGVKVLYARINAAAQQVCESLAGGRGLAATTAWNKCVSKAVSNAVQSVGQPALTAIFEEKTGTTIPTRFASLQSR